MRQCSGQHPHTQLPVEPFAAGQGTGHLRHDLELAAALANGEQVAVAALGESSDGGGTPPASCHVCGHGATSEAAEMERYHAAEAVTNLAAFLMNHILQQVWHKSLQSR